ncbi:DHH family phosphoesterase [Candidatus Bathyarchaeota archaeon]|nr:DHH family phosphoesterase [Candidatus Bathyarchaeota archaeon]
MRRLSRIRSITRKARGATILTHRNGDPDAVCSAFALRRLLRRWNPRLRVVIGTPEGVNRISERIISKFRFAVESEPRLDDADIIFTVDMNNFEQLGSIASAVRILSRPVVVIDHHHPHPSMRSFASLSLCDEKSPSTCEIICELYRRSRLRPGVQESRVLLVGILYETKYLRLGTSKTLLTVADLIRLGARVEGLTSIQESPMDISERLARLKSAQRSKIHHVGEWVVVMSSVGSHQASAARAIIMLGADLAVVGSQDREQLKLSLRSTREFYERSGIHLGRDIAKPLGDYLNGTGGGHSLAAGVNGSGQLDLALNRCLEMLEELTENPDNRRED